MRKTRDKGEEKIQSSHTNCGGPVSLLDFL